VNKSSKHIQRQQSENTENSPLMFELISCVLYQSQCLLALFQYFACLTFPCHLLLVEFTPVAFSTLCVQSSSHYTSQQTEHSDDDEPIAHKNTQTLCESRGLANITHTHTDQPKMSFLKLYSSKQHTQIRVLGRFCFIKQLLNNQ